MTPEPTPVQKDQAGPAAAKEQLRQACLDRLGQLWPAESQAPRPPIFEGRNKAAERLRRQPEYLRARTLAVMADPVLLQVRINALQDGKTLLAATPGLKQGLVRLNPGDVALTERSRMLRGGSLTQAGRPLRLPQARLGRVDLLVVPAVAVDRRGVVLGDGRGLADLLWALLGQLGALGPSTALAVLADPQQLLEDDLPRQPWDLAASLVVLPQEVLRPPAQPPAQAQWGDLPPRLAALPLVKATLLGQEAEAED